MSERRSKTSRSDRGDDERRARFRTEFGAALTVRLAERRMTQADLATAAGKSASYTNQVMSGRKGASPEWINLISQTLGLSVQDRRKLHAAAARDHGYDIGGEEQPLDDAPKKG